MRREEKDLIFRIRQKLGEKPTGQNILSCQRISVKPNHTAPFIPARTICSVPGPRYPVKQLIISLYIPPGITFTPSKMHAHAN
jgi:hypothetical protein